MRKGECPDVGIHDVLDGLADQHLVLQRTMSLVMDERRTLPCDVSVCDVSGSVKAGLPIALGPFGCGALAGTNHPALFRCSFTEESESFFGSGSF